MSHIDSDKLCHQLGKCEACLASLRTKHVSIEGSMNESVGNDTKRATCICASFSCLVCSTPASIVCRHASPSVYTFTSSSGSPGAFTHASSVTEYVTCRSRLQSTIQGVLTIQFGGSQARLRVHNRLQRPDCNARHVHQAPLSRRRGGTSLRAALQGSCHLSCSW